MFDVHWPLWICSVYKYIYTTNTICLSVFNDINTYDKNINVHADRLSTCHYLT